MRKRPEERREEILRAAGEVVLREGFGRTSARDLAAAVGVSPGLLHHYFPSMDEVLARAVELFSEEDLETLATQIGDDGVGPLVHLDRILRWCVPAPADPSCSFWVESWSEGLHNAGVAAATRGLNETWHAGLADVLRRAVEDDDARCDDPEGSAWRLLALIDGLTVQVLVYGSLGPEDLLAQLRTSAELELDLTPGTLAALEPDSTAGSDGHRRVRTTRDAGDEGPGEDGAGDDAEGAD